MMGTLLGNKVMHLLALLLILTLWRGRSHAGDGTTPNDQGAVFPNLGRLIPSHSKRRASAYSNETAACLDPSHTLASYRGGARSDVTLGALSPLKTTIKEQLKARKKAGRYEFSLFQKGDGSEEDPDGIPTRYLLMHPNNRDKAMESLQATLAWRQTHKVDTLLKKAQTKFDVSKAVFPHYFAGRDKLGHVVFVQRPGRLSIELARKNGLTKEELLEHYVYVNEYLWQVVETSSPMATLLGIMDLEGLNLRVLRQREVLSFLKLFVATMDSHFPQRAQKTMLINAPKWFNMVYKLVSPLLRDSTKSKIEILTNGKKQDKALKNRLGNNAEKLLPKSFFSEKKKRRKRKRGSENEDDDKQEDFAIPDTEFERQLRSFVSARLRESGASMKSVKPISE